MTLATAFAYDDRAIVAVRIYQSHPMIAVLPHNQTGVAEAVRISSQSRIVGWDSRAQYHKHVLKPCFRFGIATPYYKDRFGPRYRFSDDAHLDLRDFMTEYGANPCSLDEAWAVIDGTPGDGSAVCDALRIACLGIRADLVMGRITASQHDAWQMAVQSAATASLDSQKMEGRDHDYFGTPRSYGLAPHYKAFLRASVNALLHVGT